MKIIAELKLSLYNKNNSINNLNIKKNYGKSA